MDIYLQPIFVYHLRKNIYIFCYLTNTKYFFLIIEDGVFNVEKHIKKIQMAQWVRSLDLTAHTSLSPIRHGFTPNFVDYKKGCTRLAAASDKVYQLLAHGRWFSPGTPASSNTKTGRHDTPKIKSTPLKIKWLLPKAKQTYVCLRSPDPPYFSAADPNLFNRQLFHPNIC